MANTNEKPIGPYQVNVMSNHNPVAHAVRVSDAKNTGPHGATFTALCGYTPAPGSSSWGVWPQSHAVTCKRCAAKLKRPM